jgi:hypothetical protein
VPVVVLIAVATATCNLLLCLVSAFGAAQLALWAFSVSITAALVLELAQGYGYGRAVHLSGCLVYFSLAPALQYGAGTSFWGSGSLDGNAVTSSLIMVSMYMAAFDLFYSFSPRPPDAPTDYRFRRHGLLVIYGLSGLAVFVLLLNADASTTARGLQTAPIRPFEFLLYISIPKQILLFCLLSSIIALRSSLSFSNIVLACFLLTLCLYYVNPINSSRQLIYIGLLPIFILCVRNRFVGRLAVSAVTIVGLVGIGPIMNYFARDSFYGLSLTGFPNSVDFDAFANTARLADIHGALVGYGRYLANSLSFLLPRDLKPFPDFDPLLRSDTNRFFSQSNLSAPPFLTAYLDFSHFGPPVLGAIVGAAVAAIDRGILKSSSLSAMVGASLVASYISFLRGPILGMGVVAFGAAVAAAIVSQALKPHRGVN